MIYLDSCALVKLVIQEKETQGLAQWLSHQQFPLVTSDLAATEVIRVVRRSCYNAQRVLRTDTSELDQRLSVAGKLLDGTDRIPVGMDVLIRAGMYAEDPLLGSLDAIHLASALEIGPELAGFVTYDKTLAKAVSRAGLPLEQPE